MFQDDEGFWTHEDIVDLGGEVENMLVSALPDCYVVFLGGYVTDDRTFTLEVRIDDYELSESISIDMRKLKYTSDLATAYAKQFADMFICEYNNEVATTVEDCTNVLCNEAIRAGYISKDIPDVDDDVLENLYYKIHDKVIEIMMSENFGFDEDEAESYSRVAIRPFEDDDSYIIVEVGAEVSFEGQLELSVALDEVIEKFDPEAYFDMEDAGLSIAAVRKKCL